MPHGVDGPAGEAAPCHLLSTLGSPSGFPASSLAWMLDGHVPRALPAPREVPVSAPGSGHGREEKKADLESEMGFLTHPSSTPGASISSSVKWVQREDQ